ncbi:MAG: glucose-6-phosphate dehydrogenase assembly protein OpcA [Dehalococcoidia bacterium]
MAPDVKPIERLEVRPIDVDPAAIEDEFSRVWRDASGSGYDESSVRLRVLNLVAIGGADKDAERFESVMQVVPRKHPCRGILALTSDARRSVDATISAHCFREGGSVEICSEEVVLTAGSAQQRELASAVLALLVPEIPVAAWLLGRAEMTSYLTSEVIEAADVLLADSGEGDPGANIRAQFDLREKHDARMFDLAWGRSETWRELTAQFFDGDDRLQQLERIKAIEIRGYRGRASAAPMLLAGWLVSRLGYSLADLDGDEEALRATLYDGSRGVTLSVAPGWAPDVMSGLRIITDSARFELQGHELSRHLHVIEQWGAHEEMRRAVDHPALDDAALVMLGLDGSPDPEISVEAAAAALALLGG